MKILLLTLSEYGQANSVLALATELGQRSDLDVHVSSFASLEKRVDSIRSRSESPVTFHPIRMTTYSQAVCKEGDLAMTVTHPPSNKSNKPLHILTTILVPWDNEEYLLGVQQVEQLVSSLDPDIVIIDMLFTPAIDGCRLAGRRYLLNTPNQPLDLVRLSQPKLRALWYYPAYWSTIPFPVPAYLILLNIWIIFKIVFTIARCPRFNSYQAFRRQVGLKGGAPSNTTMGYNIDMLCGSIPEADYPCVLPPNLHCFGPITLDSIPLAQSDPDLKKWLDRGKTVVVSLGTHVVYTADMVNAFLQAFLTSLPKDVQILWKLKGKHQWDSLIESKLDAKDRTRFKIVDWIVADPNSIMPHHNVLCYVHHGGANSFFECCQAGLPQIIVASWFDLYDNASRAEYMGVGLYGNKSSAPGVDATEFGRALSRVTDMGDEGLRMKEKALWIAERCRGAGGRKAAVDFILQAAKKGKFMEIPE